MGFSAADILGEFVEASVLPSRQARGGERFPSRFFERWDWRPKRGPVAGYKKLTIRNRYTFAADPVVVRFVPFPAPPFVRAGTCEACGCRVEQRQGSRAVYHIGGRHGQCPARRAS